MDDFGEQNRKIIIFNWRTRKMKERNVVLILMLAFAMLAGIASGQNLSEVVKINFQQEANPVPAGYIKDYGLAYTLQNGFDYGFDVQVDATRQRGTDPDPRYDTLNHFEKSDGRYWEIALDSGLYNIFLVCGDPDNTNQINTLDLEGTIVTDPDGEDNFDEYWVYNLEVTDGRLTMAPAEGSDNSKLCFIEIYVADPAFNPPPTVEAGSDLTMWMDEAALLAGAITDEDPYDGSNPGTVTSYWVKEVGPGNVTFDPVDTTDVLDPTATFDTAGTYELRLQVSDGTADANDIVTITVLDPAVSHMIGHWEMEDNLNDSTVYANYGEPMADSSPAIAFADGIDGGRALLLDNPDRDNPNGYVHLGAAPVLDIKSNPPEFTVSAWFQTTNGSDQIIIGKGGDDDTDGGICWLLLVDSRGVRFVTDDNDNKEDPRGPQDDNDGLWHHAVGVSDSWGLRVYVDGVLTDDDERGGSYDISGSSQRPGYIGAGTEWDDTEPNDVNSNIFDGLIDDVRVYNYALPFDDPGHDSIKSLLAMGPIVGDVDAGEDITTTIRLTMPTALQGTMTDPGAPGSPVYLWETVSRPEIADSNAVFTTGDMLATDVYFPEFGEYVLSLTVNDDGGSDTSEITITVVETDCSDVIAAGLVLPGDIAGGGLEGDEPDCRVTLADVAAYAADFLRCNNPQDVDCIDPYL